MRRIIAGMLFVGKPETPQEAADRLLGAYQAGRCTCDEGGSAGCPIHDPITATVNPFPSFDAAKASDMSRVKL
jgi:hypothetical protein